MIMHLVIVLSLLLLGILTGSILNLCIDRFPRSDRLRRQLALLWPIARTCRFCHAPAAGARNIAVLTWCFGGNRCPKCRGKVALRYPVVELLTGCLFAAVYWSEIPFGASLGGLSTIEGPRGPEMISGLWSPVVWLHLRYALHMVMVCGLIVATFIDLKRREIPDGSTLPAMMIGVTGSFLVGQAFIVPVWFQDVSMTRRLRPVFAEWMQPLIFEGDISSFVMQHPHWHGLAVSVAGLVVGAASVWFVRLIGFWILKQEAMGFGDVILMAMIGSVIGWQPVLMVFFTAPLLAVFAAVVAWFIRRERLFPYGPWLSAATVLLLLTWPYTWPLAKPVFDLGPVLFVIGLFMCASFAACLQLIQIGKRLIGIGPYVDENPEDEWCSADQLQFQASERPDEQTGSWSREMWSGSRSGRGLQSLHRWKTGH